MGKSEFNEMFAALQRAQEEADRLYELAAETDPQLAMAIAHRLSSSIAGIKFAVEGLGPTQRRRRATVLRALRAARSAGSRINGGDLSDHRLAD